jgi:hypothetical protein
MATVTADEMRDKLITLEEVQNKLATSEPLNTQFISKTDKIRFEYGPEWALTLGNVHDDALVDARAIINGDTHQLTKTAALAFGAEFGLPGAYARRLPSNLLEQHLNFWYSAGMGDKTYNLLMIGDDLNITALTKPTLKPFSNIQLLEKVCEGLADYHDGEILADYKFSHSLKQTDVRLILPNYTRTITDSGTEDDVWSAGIHLSNSLTGKKLTSVEGYLFRWWCTNGATTTMPDVGVWSRKADGQNDDVYGWARESVDAIFEGVNTKFDEVQALTQLPLNGNTGDVLRSIFTQHNVPVSQRPGIIDNMLESENPTMYGVMQAITQLANDPELSPDRADKLMRIGGDVPSDVFDTVKAKVWREGFQAGEGDVNPYAITAH